MEKNRALYLQISPLTREAYRHIQRKQYAEALALLESASALVERSPRTQWPWRTHVAPPLGHVLFAIGRVQEARRVLEAGMEAHKRIRDGNLQPFIRVLDVHDTAMGEALFKTEFKRQFMSSVVLESGPTQRLGDLVFHTGAGSIELPFTLGRVLSSCNDAAALTRLYRDEVDVVPRPTTRNFTSDIAREYRYFKFAMLLAQQRQWELSGDSLSHALWLSKNNLRTTCVSIPDTTGLLERLGVRREMLSYGIGAFMLSASAAVDKNVESEQSTPDTRVEGLMAAIVETKGLATRYIAHRDRLLQASEEPGVVAVRARLDLLDEEMAALPATFAGFANLQRLGLQHFDTLDTIMPQLVAAGLGDVVTNGVELLPEIRRALGAVPALGFLVVRGLPSVAGESGAEYYLRYCLSGEAIQFRIVGACADMDPKIYRFRRDLLRGRDTAEVGAWLSRRLLDGLPRGFEAADQWVIDPDAALNLLPFEALPAGPHGPLVVHRAIRYVSSLAALAGQPGRKKDRGGPCGPACIVADPIYTTADKRRPERSIGLGRQLPDGMTLSPLPETAAEAEDVSRSLAGLGVRVVAYSGAAATPDVLLALREPPQVLHVASHALLIDTPPPAPDAERRLNWSGLNLLDLVIPGRRAGLVLAGEDGGAVLLARDLAKLPLSGTQLAVLSGCDTANGDIDPGEGVASLRRALEQAGAASTVTSLWPVPSGATANLMSDFYGALGRGTTLSAALRDAKVKAWRKGQPASAWAGFVLSGADGPLVRNDAVSPS
jgi:hypothetical protein